MRQELPAVAGVPRPAAVSVASTSKASADGAGLVEIVLRNGCVLRLHLSLGQVARLADRLER